MDVRDSIEIQTPEGLSLELTIAGLGSRFLATCVDHIVQGLLLLGLGIVIRAVGFDSLAANGVIALGAFVLIFLYPVVFEVYAGGRTPGKRVNGLRVVRADGTPVRLLDSAIRNVVRIVDFMPFFYFVGMVAVFWSQRNQRLGDMAAGVVVAREPKAFKTEIAPVSSNVTVPTWDASAITSADMLVVRHFLMRRDSIAPGARSALAVEITRKLEPRIVGLPIAISPERFLEELAALKGSV